MTKFEDLPIMLEKDQVSVDGWRRTLLVEGTIADLLDIWDIDDESDSSAMAQVLRHLRSKCQESE